MDYANIIRNFDGSRSSLQYNIVLKPECRTTLFSGIRIA